MKGASLPRLKGDKSMSDAPVYLADHESYYKLWNVDHILSLEAEATHLTIRFGQAKQVTYPVAPGTGFDSTSLMFRLLDAIAKGKRDGGAVLRLSDQGTFESVSTGR